METKIINLELFSWDLDILKQKATLFAEYFFLYYVSVSCFKDNYL